jgi:hypothetical protein
MHFSKILGVAAALLVTVCATPSFAQLDVDKNRSYFSPDNQFGIGFNNKGGTIQYALGPAFHLGINLALDFYKDSAHSGTFYDFGPYAKFLFSGNVIKPYAYAALGLVQPETGKASLNKTTTDSAGRVITVDLPDMEVRIYLAFGAEHFFDQNVGIYGHVNLVNALVSGGGRPATTEFGLQGATVGVEFFF